MTVTKIWFELWLNLVYMYTIHYISFYLANYLCFSTEPDIAPWFLNFLSLFLKFWSPSSHLLFQSLFSPWSFTLLSECSETQSSLLANHLNVFLSYLSFTYMLNPDSSSKHSSLTIYFLVLPEIWSAVTSYIIHSHCMPLASI